MRIQYINGKVVVQTPCKINPYLEVIRRRPDGYHDLETIMLAIDLCDKLIFEATDDQNFYLNIFPESTWIQQQIGYNGAQLGDIKSNLIWKS